MWALGSPALRALTTRQLEGLGERRETAPAAGAAGGGVEVEPRWQALRRRYDLGSPGRTTSWSLRPATRGYPAGSNYGDIPRLRRVEVRSGPARRASFSQSQLFAWKTMARVLAASLLATASAKVYFEETFDSGIPDRWTPSEWKVRSPPPPTHPKAPPTRDPAAVRPFWRTRRRPGLSPPPRADARVCFMRRPRRSFTTS